MADDVFVYRDGGRKAIAVVAEVQTASPKHSRALKWPAYRMLRDRGVLAGFHAEVSLAKVGLAVQALIARPRRTRRPGRR